MTGRLGMTLLEILIVLVVLTGVLLPLTQFFLRGTRAFNSLMKTAELTARANVVMERIVAEALAGRFVSLQPPAPVLSDWVRFEKVVDLVDGVPVYGEPVQIDLIPMESSITDGVDNDGDGLVDEGGVRIWSDYAPLGSSPGTGDPSAIIATNVAKDGLKFTRAGAILKIELVMASVTERGKPPKTLKMESGVKMRNNE